MVISTSVLQLLEVCLDFLANLFRLIKIHRSTLYCCIFACRNRELIHRIIISGMDRKICIKNLAASLPCKVEVGMVGHICQRRLVTDSAIVNLQGIVLCKFICNRHLEFSRESILAIRADSGKSNGIFVRICILNSPNLLLEAIGAAVKIIVILILVKLVFLSIKGKSGTCDTVSASSYDRTKEAAIYFVLLNIVITKHYICKLPIFVRNAKLHKNGTVIHHFCICTGFILQMV